MNSVSNTGKGTEKSGRGSVRTIGRYPECKRYGSPGEPGGPEKPRNAECLVRHAPFFVQNSGKENLLEIRWK